MTLHNTENQIIKGSDPLILAGAMLAGAAGGAIGGAIGGYAATGTLKGALTGALFGAIGGAITGGMAYGLRETALAKSGFDFSFSFNGGKPRVGVGMALGGSGLSVGASLSLSKEAYTVSLGYDSGKAAGNFGVTYGKESGCTAGWANEGHSASYSFSSGKYNYSYDYGYARVSLDNQGVTLSGTHRVYQTNQYSIEKQIDFYGKNYMAYGYFNGKVGADIIAGAEIRIGYDNTVTFKPLYDYALNGIYDYGYDARLFGLSKQKDYHQRGY